jgi:hypothetical protein
MTVEEVDVEKLRRAPDCCVTYPATIEAHQDGSAGAKRGIPREALFEIYQGTHDPPLCDVFDRLT